MDLLIVPLVPREDPAIVLISPEIGLARTRIDTFECIDFLDFFSSSNESFVFVNRFYRWCYGLETNIRHI